MVIVRRSRRDVVARNKDSVLPALRIDPFESPKQIRPWGKLISGSYRLTRLTPVTTALEKHIHDRATRVL